MKKKLLWLVTGLLLLLVLAAPVAMAQGPTVTGETGRVVFGSDFTLDDEDYVDGGVVVFGGNFVMREGSEVDGDVVVFGGKATIDGKVKGDVACIGGNVQLQDNAIVKGDVASVGGKINRNESAQIDGTITEGPEFKFNNGDFSVATPSLPQVPVPPVTPKIQIDNNSRSGFFQRAGSFFADGIQDIFSALLVAGLAVLVILFFPAQVKTIEDTLKHSTPTSFVLGGATILAALALLLLLGLFFWLLLPLCIIPLVPLVLAAAVLAGIAVIGKLIGYKLFAMANTLHKPTEISAVLLGVAVLVLVMKMPFVDHLPLVGWMFAVAGGLIGILVNATALGAVVLCRFGTQPYIPGTSPLSGYIRTPRSHPASTIIPADQPPVDDAPDTIL